VVPARVVVDLDPASDLGAGFGPGWPVVAVVELGFNVAKNYSVIVLSQRTPMAPVDWSMVSLLQARHSCLEVCSGCRDRNGTRLGRV